MPRWADDGIILGARPLGESGALVTCFTAEHGLTRGLVRGARRKGALLQAGNQVSLHWSARLEEHLGTWTLEPLALTGSKLLAHPLALTALSAALALTETVLPEREPQPALYENLLEMLETLETLSPSPSIPSSLPPTIPFSPGWYKAYIYYEIALLRAAGFRLSLTQCVATGSMEGLTYVSPRSGGAVCLAAGAPYKEKLIPLPAFLVTSTPAEATTFLQALDLTEYFFQRYILDQTNAALPAARNRFKDRVHKLMLRKG